MPPSFDFWKGKVGRRKEYDWSRESALVYRALLINLWSSQSLHWIVRCDPQAPELSAFSTHLFLELESQNETKDLN